jgi:hypothetical protein
MHANRNLGCVWWLKSVIPATLEVEMGRIAVQGQPSKKFARLHLNQ